MWTCFPCADYHLRHVLLEATLNIVFQMQHMGAGCGLPKQGAAISTEKINEFIASYYQLLK